jgi:hypothetical protein
MSDNPPTFAERVTTLISGLGPYQMTDMEQVGAVLTADVQAVQSRLDSGHVSESERPQLMTQLASSVAILAMLADAPPAILNTAAGSTSSTSAIHDPAA